MIETFLSKNNIDYLTDSPINKFLTIHIGGKVSQIIFTDTNSNLRKTVEFLFSNKINFIVIGGGSNIVFPDSAPDLTVIINRTSEVNLMDGNIVKVNSGLKNSVYLDFCKKNSLAGFEFLAGIPGSIGGAVAVNAGAYGKSISKFITGADIFSKDGEFKYVTNNYFNFEYRNSSLKYGNDVLINIYMKYNHGSETVIRQEIDEIVKQRIKNHPPYSSYTAGCFFKNPVCKGEKISAGKLIEECNLKGIEDNNITVSKEHANFIVNNGLANFSDIKHIEEKVQKTVLKKKGVKLEREVIFVSPEGKKY